jgi:carboxylesterase
MRPVTSPLLPGAEPFSHRGGPDGVLVLHGFTGNPQSMRALAQALAGAGYTVELPLWPGHGTAMEDMLETRWSDWAGAAEAAYDQLAARCRSVTLVALSMGGTLACHLAAHRGDVRAMVLVNPLVEPPADSFLDILRGLLDEGTEIAPGVGSDIAKPGVVESAYPGTPLAPALSLFEGVATVAGELDRISCPILLFSSRSDHVVPPTSGDVLQAGVRGPLERIWLERSYHVATLDYDADDIARRTLAFVADTGGASPTGPVPASSGAPSVSDPRPS